MIPLCKCGNKKSEKARRCRTCFCKKGTSIAQRVSTSRYWFEKRKWR